MTEATHTPGPWAVEGRSVYFLDWDGRSYDDGKPSLSNRWFLSLQGQTWTSGTGNPPRCSESELEANARLIAAAPDMFNALCTVGNVLSRLSITTKDDELFAAYSQLLAAITKARGA